MQWAASDPRPRASADVHPLAAGRTRACSHMASASLSLGGCSRRGRRIPRASREALPPDPSAPPRAWTRPSAVGTGQPWPWPLRCGLSTGQVQPPAPPPPRPSALGPPRAHLPGPHSSHRSGVGESRHGPLATVVGASGRVRAGRTVGALPGCRGPLVTEGRLEVGHPDPQRVLAWCSCRGAARRLCVSAALPSALTGPEPWRSQAQGRKQEPPSVSGKLFLG